MRALSTFGIALALVVACCAACSPAAPSGGAKAPAARAPAAALKHSNQQRLLAALRSVERPRPVLELLDAPATGVLDARLKSLTPEQREQLVTGELAEAMPLLHLRAGGGSGRALLALATTPVASQELPLAFEPREAANDSERERVVRLAGELAQRAALHFLRDRVLDISGLEEPSERTAPLFAALERAAEAAERRDIARLVLEMWAEHAPGPEVLAELGSARARDHDGAGLQAAQAALPASATAERARLAALWLSLSAAATGADPVTRAWGELSLGRYADAGALLEPLVAQAPADLRVAAGLAVVAAAGSACPGLPRGVGSPRLCAMAVKVRPGLARALVDMERAFQSKAGRDAASIEAYLGLSHVVPWVSEMSLASDATSLESNFTKRHERLAAALAELPEQRPLAVFAAALAAGVKAGLRARPGQRPVLDPAQQRELLAAALAESAAAPRLAVASVLASEQSVLALLPNSVPRELASARAGLLAWEAASGSEARTLESAKAALAELVGQVSRDGSERPAAVLLLAELTAAAAPSEQAYQALAQVSGQLIGEPLPPELALRAVLDAAGALERLGRSKEALGVLEQAARIESLPGPAADLLSLIRAEKAVLEWDKQRDPERKALAKQLAALRSAAPPPSLSAVLDAWSSPNALREGKQKPRQLLEARLGARTAELLARGSLRATRVSLRVGYTFEAGVTPEVLFEPMLVPLVRPDLILKAL